MNIIKTFGLLLSIVSVISLVDCKSYRPSQPGMIDTILLSDTIIYHPVRISKTDGSILPWYSADPGESFDTVLTLVWNFWKNMVTDSNGLKYYMNHQVWKPEDDMRGLGGDQLNMALSSWALLYAYTGDQSITENMIYIADTYLARSLSDYNDAWPFLPYPYNTVIHSGIYDGDMRNGKYILQPDKAGNFGYELINLYKITGELKYLDAAKRIGRTLMIKVKPGDNENSPLPFRVNAKTGELGKLSGNNGSGKKVSQAGYTSNWTGTLMLFMELMKFDEVLKANYLKAFDVILIWMKSYPMKTNKWGPFFEDIPGWSDTQTNAVTFAMFVMQHPDLFPSWKEDVRSIFEWTHRELGNREYEKYKVEVMNEQTVYRVPGNSHSSRQSSVELLYTNLSSDSTWFTNAVRALNWATYTVASDGRNRYIRDDIWLTDGYGDYVRHFLRAMAAWPELAPGHKNKLLSSTSVITFIIYGPDVIDYNTFDDSSTEVIRLKSKPELISVYERIIPESSKPGVENWTWQPLSKGGILTVNHNTGNKIRITL